MVCQLLIDAVRYSPIEELMAWALTAAHQQHAQAIADATAAYEAAQRTGQGPKPMMVTPYKHNWVISGMHPENDVGLESQYALKLSLNLSFLDGSTGRGSQKICSHYGKGGQYRVKTAAVSPPILQRTGICSTGFSMGPANSIQFNHMPKIRIILDQANPRMHRTVHIYVGYFCMKLGKSDKKFSESKFNVSIVGRITHIYTD